MRGRTDRRLWKDRAVLELAFVLARRQNRFFAELVEVIRDELGALGVRSSVSLDGFPAARPGLVYALVPPHEWVALHGGAVPPPELLARTVVLCTEQPGTWFFDANAPIAAAAGAAFDISPFSVAEWRRRGIRAERFTLGHTARWAAPELDGPRDVELAFLGSSSERRNRLLASYAPMLARRSCRLVVHDAAGPNSDGSAGFLVGEAKRALLRRTRVLLNVHVGDEPYFEHLRAMEAVLSGAVLVSEHGPGAEPLVAGADFLSGRAESLAHLAAEVLEDEDRRKAIQATAAERLLEHPLRAAAERLATAAAGVDRAAPVPSRAAWRPPPAPEPSPRGPADVAGDGEGAALRGALKRVRLDGIETRRRLARLEARLLGAEPAAIEILERTPSYAAAGPRVSVLVSLFEYERHIVEALDSVARSTLRPVELVVVDDGSEDRSAERTREWLVAHPETPAILLRHRWNRGLPQARNAALDFARAPLVFVLDADNALYPHGLERLAAALDAEPSASFAYGILECFSRAGPAGLISYGPWRPERLREGNYVDAMALVRADALRTLRGYATDPRLHGWEDYELWCRMAETGRHGTAVPEIVGRYRVSEHSMLRSVTQLSYTEAFSVLAERHPVLMAGVVPPG
jgi:hypothetical protein